MQGVQVKKKKPVKTSVGETLNKIAQSVLKLSAKEKSPVTMAMVITVHKDGTLHQFNARLPGFNAVIAAGALEVIKGDFVLSVLSDSRQVPS